MLSRADAVLVAREPDLPGLALVLDTDALASSLVSFGVDSLDDLRASYVRLKPGTSCLVAYDATVAGMRHRLYAKATNVGSLKLDKARLPPRMTGPFGWGRRVAEASATLISWFPTDAKLGKLSAICADCTTLSYKPERRWVGRVRGGDVVRRVYAPAEFAHAADVAGRLGDGATLRLARFLDRDDRKRLLTFSWLEGRALASELATESAEDCLERAGRALGELHLQRTALAPRLGPDLARSVVAAADHVAHLLPGLGRHARELARRVASALMVLHIEPQPVHGDFDPRQVLVQTQGIAFLDLDEAAVSDPAVDLASFRARLLHRAFVEGGSRSAVDAATSALLRGHRELLGETAPARLALHNAAALLRLLPLPFRERRLRWDEDVEQLLVEAERDAASAFSASPTVVAHRRDPALPWLEEALSVERAAVHLGSAVGAAVRVASAQLVRHKPGRRALIAYELTAGNARHSLLAKLRRRGADHGTFALHARLRAAGLDGSGPSATAVPEPFALIADLGLWCWHRAPGRPAVELLTGSDGLATASRLADALRTLHMCGLRTKPRYGARDELDALEKRLRVVAENDSDLSRDVHSLTTMTDDIVAAMPAVPGALLHRDFYHDQALIDGDRVWLIDLDLCAEGDPALDVGNFIAHLEELAIREPSSAPALSAASARFRARYAELDGGLAEPRVNAWAALALARLVAISRSMPERRDATAAILKRAIAWASEAPGARGTPVGVARAEI